jgi:hypothetical protein
MTGGTYFTKDLLSNQRSFWYGRGRINVYIRIHA